MKKKLSLIIALAMLASTALTACSEPATDEDSSTDNGTTTSQADESDDEGDTEETTGELKTVDVIITINPATDDLNDNVFYNEVAAMAGLDIEWDCISADWSTTKAALLAANDLPDAFMGNWVFSAQEVEANKALFAPLEDLIAEYAPTLQAGLEDPLHAPRIQSPDGSFYYLTTYIDSPYNATTGNSIQVNQTWLNNLGIEVPETIEEFDAMLQAFKDEDANGNGDPNDEIPYYASITGNEAWSLRAYEGAFGAVSSWSHPYFVIEGDTVKYTATTDEWKDYVIWSSSLRERGLAPESMATDTWTERSAYLGTEIPTVGVTNSWIKDPINPEYQDEYAAIPQLTGPNGDHAVTGTNSMSQASAAFVLPADGEYNVDFIKFAEIISADPMIALQIQDGPIGTRHELVDGQLLMVEPPEGVDADTWAYKNSANGAMPMYVPRSAMENLYVETPYHSLNKLNIDAVYVDDIDPNTVFPLIVFTEEENEELSIIKTDIDAHRNEAIANWFVNGGVEETWDQYIADANSYGLERYIEIYQAAYARAIAE